MLRKEPTTSFSRSIRWSVSANQITSLWHAGYSERRTGEGRGDLLVGPDGLALLKTELIHVRSLVRIPFFHVRMSSCEASGDETKIHVMVLEADGGGSFVAHLRVTNGW